MSSSVDVKIFILFTKYVKVIFFTAIVIFCSNQSTVGQIIPAHMHNDYSKNPPLSYALKHNIQSIEIDVHAKGDSLKIAHVKLFGLKNKPTLRHLYLDPLVNLIEKGKYIFKDQSPITLMIDFKTKSKKSLSILRKIVKEYHTYFCSHEDSISDNKRQIKIMLSGRIPFELLTLNDMKYFSIDGRFYTQYAHWLKPYITRISYPFKKAIRKSNNQLQRLVQSAQRLGKKVRFYAAPSDEKNWSFLLDLGVDIINIDDAERFTKFYKKRLNKE